MSDRRFWFARCFGLCMAVGCFRFHVRNRLCCRKHVMESYFKNRWKSDGTFGPPVYSYGARRWVATLPWWQRVLLPETEAMKPYE